MHSRAVNRLHAEEKCGKPHLYESGKPHESTVDFTPDVRIISFLSEVFFQVVKTHHCGFVRGTDFVPASAAIPAHGCT